MILVDVLGIRGSVNVTDKLIEDLPNAMLFFFVINGGSAGGMQNDSQGIYSIIKSYIDNILPNQTKIKQKHFPVFFMYMLLLLLF